MVGLARLGVPYRARFAITLSFRLAPLFIDSYLTVVDAESLRGLDFGRGRIIDRLKRYAPVVIPVFMGALAQGQQHGDGARGAGLRDESSSQQFHRISRPSPRHRDGRVPDRAGRELFRDVLDGVRYHRYPVRSPQCYTHRSRSIVSAISTEARRRRQLRALAKAAGSWKDRDHPELKGGALRWVSWMRGKSEGCCLRLAAGLTARHLASRFYPFCASRGAC